MRNLVVRGLMEQLRRVFAAVTPKHQVQTFGRRYLDPRRPKTKPTPQEMEEMLAQYDPLLPDDPRRIVSHNYDVRTKASPCEPSILLF